MNQKYNKFQLCVTPRDFSYDRLTRSFFLLLQVSSDLSIVDLDVPFAFVFSLGASLNAYSNLGVLAVVTWQVLFVSVPMIVLGIWLQVICMTLFLYAKPHAYDYLISFTN